MVVLKGIKDKMPLFKKRKTTDLSTAIERQGAMEARIALARARKREAIKFAQNKARIEREQREKRLKSRKETFSQTLGFAKKRGTVTRRGLAKAVGVKGNKSMKKRKKRSRKRSTRSSSDDFDDGFGDGFGFGF